MNLETANYQALISDRDAALRRAELAEADVLVLTNTLENVHDVFIHEKNEAENDTRYGDAEFFCDEAEKIQKVLDQPHPGQSLLERMKVLERIAARLKEICDMQQRNYGHGSTTHMDLADLCAAAAAELAKLGGE